MSDPFDIYSDVFAISITPWGANLSFQLREAHPTTVSPKQPKQQGTVRMSNEHLKTLTFMCTRQLKKFERDNGVQCQVPNQVLAQLGIAPDDWDAFWQQRGG